MNPDQRISAALLRYNDERDANDELHDEMASIIQDLRRRLLHAHSEAYMLRNTQGAIVNPSCRKDVDKLYRATDLKQEFMV